MSSTRSAPIQPLYLAAGSRVPSEHFPLVCPSCGETAWLAETEQLLRCESCQTGVPVRNKIIECLHMSEKVGSPETGWDTFYRERTKPYSAEQDWWCLSCWRSHLFGDHLGDLSGKLVVDFGCGRAVRVAALAPISIHGYDYVGIDSSLEPLTWAAQAMPGGIFIRGNLESLRLRVESADFVLCLGLLMYAEDFAKSMGRLLDVLKPGGILLLHEQVRRKSWRQFFQRLLKLRREAYPPAHGVMLHELESQLDEHGKILHRHLGGSPLRRLFMRLLDGSFLEPLRPAASWLDSTWCVTAGRMFPAIGASEVQIVFQKT